MRKILIFVMSLLSVVLALSCNKDEEKLNEVSFLPVTEGEISASWSGGTYIFEYEIENPTQTGVVTPSCEAEWLSDWRTGVYGKVSFTVAENPSESERTATVRLDYEDKYLEFTVRQQGKSIEGNSYFQIEFNNVTTTSFDAKVTPSDITMQYVVLSSKAEDMVGFEDDELLFEDAISYYRSIAQNYGMSLAAAVEQFLVSDVYEGTISNLDIATEYCLFVIGLSVSGDEAEMLAPIARGYVTTKSVDRVDVEFDIQIDAQYTGGTASKADVVITPDNTEVKYYAALLTQTDYDIFGKAMPDVAEGYLRNFLNGLIYQYNWTLKDIYDMYALNGVYRQSYDVKPKYNYWMTAFAVDEAMNIASDVAYEEFQAPGIDSDNQITLKVQDVTATTASVDVSVTNNDPYVVLVMEAWTVQGMDDEYLMWSVVDYYDLASAVITGSVTGVLFENLAPGTEHVALAFGYDGGSYTTGLSRVDFVTENPGSGSDCEFEFNVTNLRSRSVDVEVVPSDPSVNYYWELRPADETEEDVRQMYEESIAAQIAAGQVSDAAEYWAYTAIYRGTDRYSWTLQPGEEFVVMAVVPDMTTGEIVAVRLSEPYTAPNIVSDVTCTLDLSKFYDGDALHEADPGNYGTTVTGKALLDVSAELTGNVAHWYHYIVAWDESYNDFTDNQLIDNLLYFNNVDGQNDQWLCTWDKEYFAIAVAEDTDGEYGVVSRQRFSMSKEDASPVDELIGGNRVRSEARQTGAALHLPSKVQQYKR